MNGVDILLVLLLLIIVGLALRKIIRDKRSGRACSSCSAATGTCSCCSGKEQERSDKVQQSQ